MKESKLRPRATVAEPASHRSEKNSESLEQSQQSAAALSQNGSRASSNSALFNNSQQSATQRKISSSIDASAMMRAQNTDAHKLIGSAAPSNSLKVAGVNQLVEDEDLLQGKAETAQLADEEELLQGKDIGDAENVQLKSSEASPHAIVQLDKKWKELNKVEQKIGVKENEAKLEAAAETANAGGARDKELAKLRSVGRSEKEQDTVTSRLQEQIAKVAPHNAKTIAELESSIAQLDDDNPEKKLLSATLEARKINVGADTPAWSAEREQAKQENIPSQEEIFVGQEDRVKKHLGKFAAGAHAFNPPEAHARMVGTLYHPSFEGWGSGSIFLAPLDEANVLSDKAQSDKGIDSLELLCGIPNGSWRWHNPNNEMYRYFVPPTSKLGPDASKSIAEQYTMATGKELTAAPGFWNAGGITTGGLSEAALAAIPRESLFQAIASNSLIIDKEVYKKTPPNDELVYGS
jgi:hypothetical protein